MRTNKLKVENGEIVVRFPYATPSKTKTIIVDSDGGINKIVGIME